jgi:uncharacterized cupredoxin-like copper-binding protein
MKFVAPVVLAALLPLALPAAAADYITNAADIVKAADWKTVQTVTVELKETDYTPDGLTFKANQPYKLVLKNVGQKPHYFTAPEFYKSIATRKAETAEAEFKAPYYSAIEVNPGGTAYLFFVPVKTGTFDVYCTIEDHRDKGMDGKIVVE